MKPGHLSIHVGPLQRPDAGRAVDETLFHRLAHARAFIGSGDHGAAGATDHSRSATSQADVAGNVAPLAPLLALAAGEWIKAEKPSR